jgi:hypothetical protein
MLQKLKELNFNDLLILDTDVSKYDFNEYIKNGCHKIKGFCTKCEEKGINFCPDDENYKLQAISHGSMSNDFILALKNEKIDTSNWKNDGVLFIMEGPSNIYDFYEEKEYNGFKKYPSVEWYWIHDNQDKYIYPDYFKGGEYGRFFNSIIFTFELKNAYLTNFVKCGLNDKDGNYKGINDYNQECVKYCFNEYLLREIEILKPKIVFCFGSNPENYLWNNYPKEYPFHVISLPHPAGQRRGFKDVFYRHLYFNLILEGLFKSGIYSFEETIEKYKAFLINGNI